MYLEDAFPEPLEVGLLLDVREELELPESELRLEDVCEEALYVLLYELCEYDFDELLPQDASTRRANVITTNKEFLFIFNCFSLKRGANELTPL